MFASALVWLTTSLRLRGGWTVESGLNDGLATAVRPDLLGGKYERSHFTMRPAGVGSRASVVGVGWWRRWWRWPGAPISSPLSPGRSQLVRSRSPSAHAIRHPPCQPPYLRRLRPGRRWQRLRPRRRDLRSRSVILLPNSPFAALLLFEALITLERLPNLQLAGWLLAVLAIVVVRPHRCCCR